MCSCGAWQLSIGLAWASSVRWDTVMPEGEVILGGDEEIGQLAAEKENSEL